MKNDKKIPLDWLVFQILCLSAGVYFHVAVRSMFDVVIEELDLRLSAIEHLVLYTPLVIAGLGGSFLLFLWAWKYSSLENKNILALTNVLPIVFIFILFVLTSIFSRPIPLIGPL